MRRKILILSIFVFVVTLITVIAVWPLKEANEASVSADRKTEKEKFVLLIDAGHGGFDGGAVAKDGTSEKDINLNIAKKLAETAGEYPVETVMIRDIDMALDSGEDSIKSKKQSDLKRRKEIIEEIKPDLTISIHLNSYTDDVSVYGAQVFYPNKKQKRTGLKSCEELSKTYAENIQESLEINIDDGRERKAMAKGDTYLFRTVETPIVLVECGFLSNDAELEKLKTAEYQGVLAEAIWKGINKSLGLEKKQKIQIIQDANK